MIDKAGESQPWEFISLPYNAGISQCFIIDFVENGCKLSMYIPIAYTNKGEYVDMISERNENEKVKENESK